HPCTVGQRPPPSPPPRRKRLPIPPADVRQTRECADAWRCCRIRSPPPSLLPCRLSSSAGSYPVWSKVRRRIPGAAHPFFFSALHRIWLAKITPTTSRREFLWA